MLVEYITPNSIYITGTVKEVLGHLKSYAKDYRTVKELLTAKLN